jgi:hypothetical protein
MEQNNNYDRIQRPHLFPNIKNYVSSYTKTREKVNKYTNLDDKVSLAPSWQADGDKIDPFSVTPFTAYGKRDDEENIELIRYLHNKYPNLFKHDYKEILPFLKQRESEEEALRFQEFVVNTMGGENGYKREKLMKMFPEFEKMRLDTISQMETLLEKLCHIVIYGYEDDEDLELLMQINEGNLTWHKEALQVCLGTHKDQRAAAGKNDGKIPTSGDEEEKLQGILSGQYPLDFEQLFRIDETGKLNLNIQKDNRSKARDSVVTTI